MNNTATPFASEDFAGTVMASARRLNGSVTQFTSFITGSDFLFAVLTPGGIAASVNRIAVERAATLPTPLRQRIAELSALPTNWDHEGATTVKSHVLADVVEALKRFAQRRSDFREPFLAPTFDGFIQLEWHDKRRSLEIEAVERGWSVVGTMLGNDGDRHYFSIDCERSDFERLEAFYDWFLGIELLWPSL